MAAQETSIVDELLRQGIFRWFVLFAVLVVPVILVGLFAIEHVRDIIRDRRMRDLSDIPAQHRIGVEQKRRRQRIGAAHETTTYATGNRSRDEEG